MEHLGQKSQEAIEKIETVGILRKDILHNVKLVCDEFTCLCPVTKQPDFGVVEINYVPIDLMIETKSLKLYLWKFRDRGMFAEDLSSLITKELYEEVKPEYLLVKVTYKSRGGIVIEATSVMGEE